MSKRFLTVGSLLRPEKLLAYKRTIESRDDITYPFYNDLEGYEQTEIEATIDVIAKQVAHNFPVITDGEYSKSLWHLDFVWGFSGMERFIAPHGYFFFDKDETHRYETRRDVGLRITDELRGKNHHFIHVYKRLQSLAGGRPTKLCIPSPSHIFGELSWSNNIGGVNSVYETTDALKGGLIRAYSDFVTEFAAAGGSVLQFDDCLWSIFADDNPNSPYTGKSVDQKEVRDLAQSFVDLNNTLIDLGHSLGLKVWTHNCRGNYESRNMGGGSYAKTAEFFLKGQKYDRFLLEWDDDRAGSIIALEAFKNKPEAEVVLGVLSSKTNTLDDEDRAVRLLNEAANIIGKDRLYLSHQCGFASCDSGNELTEEQQWAKIEQGQKIAQAYWGE
jgi:methionine synthase II (cobalamin-independent)